jgi:hypothetical protein
MNPAWCQPLLPEWRKYHGPVLQDDPESVEASGDDLILLEPLYNRARGAAR